MCRSSTLAVLADSDPYVGLLLTVLGSRSDFHSCCTPRCGYVFIVNTQFWPILTRFVDYYSPIWGPAAISVVVEPQGVLTCRSSTLAVLAVLGRFMDYYSLFWGPEVVSMVNEPCGAFMCRSPTLAVLADSDPYLGLLLTVLGSRSDFQDRRTPRCAYVSVISTRSFG